MRSTSAPAADSGRYPPEPNSKTGSRNKLWTRFAGPPAKPNQSNGTNATAPPARNFFVASRFIERRSGKRDATNAGAKSQRHNNARPPQKPPPKQRRPELTLAIIHSAQSANATAGHQVFAHTSVPLSSTKVTSAHPKAIKVPQRCTIPKIASRIRIR